MEYELKKLSAHSLPAAIAKAEQYRALNEPEEAESICRDVLAAAPTHQAALRTLGLALTDQFPGTGWTRLLDDALAEFEKLDAPYERAYYAGIAWERCGRAQLDVGQYQNWLHSFEQALALFEKAEQLAALGAPDPLLRWNSCVRTLTRTLSRHPEILSSRESRRPAAIDVGD